MKKVTNINSKNASDGKHPAGISELDSIKSILLGDYAKTIDDQLSLLEQKIDKQQYENMQALNALSQKLENIDVEKPSRQNLAALLAELSEKISARQ